MKTGDIVLLPFPQADLGTGKLRLALVIAIAPGQHGDLLLALVTSRLYQRVEGFDEVIAPEDADFGLSGLKVRSVIRIAHLASADRNVIAARLGRFRRSDWHASRNA